MRKPIEVPKSPHRSAIQRLAILLIPVLFIGITSLNLLYPIPTGPPDNGDFNRIFSSFSSGPLGFDFWPATENQKVYQQRFYNFYHRFWRHDEGKKEFAHFSSSSLFFLPGRCLNLTPGIFDLAWNTFFLILLGGGVLYLCLEKIHESMAIFSMGALALLFADVNIAGYLNSFYQESGTFLSFLLWIWFLHVFFAHRSLLSLVNPLRSVSHPCRNESRFYPLGSMGSFFPIDGDFPGSPEQTGVGAAIRSSPRALFFSLPSCSYRPWLLLPAMRGRQTVIISFLRASAASTFSQ